MYVGRYRKLRCLRVNSEFRLEEKAWYCFICFYPYTPYRIKYAGSFNYGDYPTSYTHCSLRSINLVVFMISIFAFLFLFLIPYNLPYLAQRGFSTSSVSPPFLGLCCTLSFSYQQLTGCPSLPVLSSILLFPSPTIPSLLC